MDDMEVFRINCELARRINKEALANPSSPYAGKFVGIANGQVVFVGDDSLAAFRHLLQIEPNQRRRCCFEASRDYSSVEYDRASLPDSVANLPEACPIDDVETMRLNKEIAYRIWQEVRADPSSPYAGKFVGIANGQVVHIGDEPDTALRRLREIEPNILRGCYFEPSRPPEYV